MNEPVRNLSDFHQQIRSKKDFYGRKNTKELWFRGETEKYDNPLRPQLYRPRKDKALKPDRELQQIENELYEQFRRIGYQLSQEIDKEGEASDWDWYFLMQHHNGPTRLLDWSDGSLIALHFAVRQHTPDEQAKDAFVYVLEPDRLVEKLENLPNYEIAKKQWKEYLAKYPSTRYKEDDWDAIYLPRDNEDFSASPLPRIPLVLEFPHITKRVAAQRSRFIVFGTDPNGLSDKLTCSDQLIQAITIDGPLICDIQDELRDAGITESMIYPDLDGLGREIKQLWDKNSGSRAFPPHWITSPAGFFPAHTKSSFH